jgi:hypothetical protein
MGHFKEICKMCGTIISQCRCMDCNKEVTYNICDACKQKAILLSTLGCDCFGYVENVGNDGPTKPHHWNYCPWCGKKLK